MEKEGKGKKRSKSRKEEKKGKRGEKMGTRGKRWGQEGKDGDKRENCRKKGWFKKKGEKNRKKSVIF